MPDLSILIPARNEQWLARTIADILEHSQGDTEIIAVLDGQWAEPPISDHPRVTLIHHPESIGQRAATNEAARISAAKYVLKCDAHCAFAPGFDVALMAPYESGELAPDVTSAPTMRNLHVFDWVCPNGHTRYQGPSGPCITCGEPTAQVERWIAKTNPTSTAYCFDATPHFQYFHGFKKRPEGKGELTESMSLQGSCFFMTRAKYLELNICDEALGTWGSQGIEVALKTWLSGGRVVINQRTWYAHMFRTQGGDFGFPYHLSNSQVERAKDGVRELFFRGRWPGLKRPLSWLLDKFWPVPGWTGADWQAQKDREAGQVAQLTPYAPPVGMIYYTDNRLDPTIDRAVRTQLEHCRNGHAVVSASLKPVDLGNNIVIDGERGVLTMFRQILAALEASTADIVFLCEHDVLYHPSHFDFRPARKDVFYYNQNTWKVDAATGRALFYVCNQTLGLCAYRSLLLEHYRARVARVERDGFQRSMGFEPGTHAAPRGVDNYGAEAWMSAYPNIDIRHGGNLTKSRWSQDQFRDQKYCQGWIESDSVPGWGKTLGQFDKLLAQIGGGYATA